MRAGALARRASSALQRLTEGQRPPGDGPAQQIPLDYVVDPAARWGYGRPSHPELLTLLESRRSAIAARLQSLVELVPELSEIPFDADGTDPRWVNGYCQGLDAASLYGFVARGQPSAYVEVGSGHSTRFVRRAIERHGLSTRITSIDPAPRASLDGLVDHHIEARLEEIDLGLFEALGPGDVVMLDGSHRAFTNSDVTVFFCEVLPRLASGVLLYVDDIFLPWDYPPQLAGQWWSEQYLLACWLLAGDRLEITLPCFWVSTEPELHGVLAPLWDSFTWAAVPTNGTGFWTTVR